MDIVVARTRLQALIISNLIGSGVVQRPFLFVKLHQFHINEDHHSVYAAYERISKEASFSLSFVSAFGLAWPIFSMICLCWVCMLSRGRIFVSSINWLPFAISLRLTPFAKVYSFDDGSANVNTASVLYNMFPAAGDGLRRRILRFLFREGHCLYVRRRITKHYTIFEHKKNIVKHSRVCKLRWNWSDFLDPQDVECLPSNVSTVVLGTVLQDVEDGTLLEKLQDLTSKCDIYIKHPREREREREVAAMPGALRLSLSSPAESVLEYIARDRKIVVYHVNSTVAMSAMRFRHNMSFVDITQ